MIGLFQVSAVNLCIYQSNHSYYFRGHSLSRNISSGSLQKERKTIKKMAGEFHSRHGSLIFLSNQNHSARRRNPATEFNNGLIFSKCALKGSEIYEVRIDRKISNWSGSLSIGVTTSNPGSLEIPSSASGLKNGSWIMSGVSILKDGASYKDEYGQDLDELNEGDRVGVQKQSDGTLHFFINGVDQGVAATAIPSSVFAVIDLYGKCVEISLHKPYLQANGKNFVSGSCFGER